MIYLLQHMLDQSAELYPQHPAMRFKGQALNYTELSERSNELAHFLLKRGIKKGDRIGVFLNKSLETVISIYGIMKAGGAYVPLDPKSPLSRLVTIIEDGDIRGIISEKSKKNILNEVATEQAILEFIIGCKVDAIDSYSWDDVEAMPSDAVPNVGLMEHDLAYIMYTSGTTGKPKGMMHTHYSGLSYARMSANTYGITHEDRLSNHSPLHFDMSTFDYLTAVLCGATTTVIPEAYTIFPANLTKLIQDEKLTIWYSVPFALIQMLMRGVMEERDMSSLRWILYGGEAFPSTHMRKLMTSLPNAQVSNVFGPAETNQSSYFNIPHPDTWDEDDYRIPVGYMVENTQCLILDENDNPVADGEVGEWVVRTPGMMKGYWARPELNKKAFYRHQRYPDFEEVYVRTGDLVYIRPDGAMDFLGRKDHQVKVRGFRIELSEIDSVLSVHPAIEEASSFVIKHPDGDQVWATITLIEGEEFSERDLLNHASNHLATYAVPSNIIIKETFPRGGTGKINRRALQEEAQAELNQELTE